MQCHRLHPGKMQKGYWAHKVYGNYDEKDYDYYVTIAVGQDWMDNRKITLLD